MGPLNHLNQPPATSAHPIGFGPPDSASVIFKKHEKPEPP